MIREDEQDVSQDPPQDADVMPGKDSTSWPTAWPLKGPDLQTRLVYLDTLTEDDAERSWPLFSDRMIAEIFALAYGRTCKGPLDLKTVFADHSRDPYMYGHAFAIHLRQTKAFIGWVALTPPAREICDPVSWTIFLPARLRMDRGFDAMYILTEYAFEVIGHEVIRARLGTEPGNPGDLGFSLMGVMRRLHVRREGDRKSEIMVILKERWPSMKTVSKALLFDPEPTTGSENLDHGLS